MSIGACMWEQTWSRVHSSLSSFASLCYAASFFFHRSCPIVQGWKVKQRAGVKIRSFASSVAYRDILQWCKDEAWERRDVYRYAPSQAQSLNVHRCVYVRTEMRKVHSSLSSFASLCYAASFFIHRYAPSQAQSLIEKCTMKRECWR